MKSKIALSLVLVIVLCTVLCAGVSAGLMPSNKIINDFDTFVIVPKAGVAVPFVLDDDPSSQGAKVAVDQDTSPFYDGIAWYDVTAEKYLSPGDYFSGGHVYRLRIRLNALSGYVFAVSGGASNVHASVNGEACLAVGYDKNSDGNVINLDTKIELIREFDKLPGGSIEISQVTVIGEISVGTILSTDNFSSPTPGVASVVSGWKDSDAVEVDPGTPAKAGKYYPRVVLTASPGYQFIIDTEVSYAGQTTYIYNLEQSQTVAYASFETITVACDHSGDTSDWKKDTNGHWKHCTVCDSDYGLTAHSFDDGVPNGAYTDYTCSVCGFTYSVMNGVSGTVSVTLPDFQFSKTFGDICRETAVSMASGTPKVVSFTVESQSAGYSETFVHSIEANTWMLAGGGDPVKAMAEHPLGNTEYTLTINVDTGKFVENKDLKVQNPDNRAESYTTNVKEDTLVIVHATYRTKDNAISLIKIHSFTAPAAGNLPASTLKFELAEGLKLNSIVWNTANPSEKFTCDKEYFAVISVEADLGYKLAPDAKAEIEGCTDVSVKISGDVAEITAKYPKIAHSFGEVSVIKEPTATEPGEGEKVCSACGAKESVVLEATGTVTSASDSQSQPGVTTVPDSTDAVEPVTSGSTADTSSSPSPAESSAAGNTDDGNKNPDKLLTVLLITACSLLAAACGVIVFLVVKNRKHS